MYVYCTTDSTDSTVYVYCTTDSTVYVYCTIDSTDSTVYVYCTTDSTVYVYCTTDSTDSTVYVYCTTDSTVYVYCTTDSTVYVYCTTDSTVYVLITILSLQDAGHQGLFGAVAAILVELPIKAQYTPQILQGSLSAILSSSVKPYKALEQLLSTLKSMRIVNTNYICKILQRYFLKIFYRLKKSQV